MTGLRIGWGYDVHALTEGRPLILGGVTVPHDRGLAGHSDADVLLHAVMDALLGAAAMGDIGVLFPDTDDAYLGVSSMDLLQEVGRRIAGASYTIVNIDATIVAQAPKLSPYRDRMRMNIADRLGIGVDRVSVKATTEERLGFTGRREGIGSQAVALLEKV